MLDDKTIGVVVPAYNEEKQIGKVISSIPDFVDRIVVVDDGSTDDTVTEARRFQRGEGSEERVFVVRREGKRGVGHAIAEGYKWMAEKKIDVTAVMAGDGQMDPSELKKIIRPIVDGRADYVKGNRLLTENSWKKIPKQRFIGNAILSFLTKIASGYWSVIDSQSGYTAISHRALATLDLDRIYGGYGVPNDILAKLNVFGFRMAQIPIEPVYNVGEKSKMRVLKVILPISFLLFRLFIYRLFYKYLVRDFHPIFLFYLTGIAFFLLGSIGGTFIMVVDVALALGAAIDIEVSYGWMLFFTVFLLSGINLLLFAMWMDMSENKDLQINVLPDRKYDEDNRL
jgi:glycosyltransferase involved in cell wall biosynthesis